MLREAREETGQTMKIVKVGPLIEFLDEYGRAVAVPFILRPDPKRRVVVVRALRVQMDEARRAEGL